MSTIQAIDIPTIITWVATVAIPAVIAVVQSFRAGGLKAAFGTLTDLMTERKPMTEEQKQLIQSGKVDEGTWKMSEDKFNDMCKALEFRDILINKDTLRDTIRSAEADCNVDYGILITDKQGNVKNGTHIYVLYGTPMYQSRAEVEHNASVNGAKIYTIPEWWYLTDLRKNQMLSEIGISAEGEQCVDRAIAKINREEELQTEKYTIECGAHFWVVERGHIVKRGAGAKNA